MKKMFMSLLLVTIIATSAYFATSCGKTDKLVGVDVSAMQSTTDTTTGFQKPNAAPMYSSHNGGTKVLPVKWVSQILPGSTSTHTCGQATTLGIYAFHQGFTPTTSMIKDENNFLDRKFPGRGYATANSAVTGFSGDNTLGTLITQYFGYKYGAVQGTSINDFQHFINAIDKGYPIIACCEISDGWIVNYDATDHWVSIVGYTLNNGGGFYINNAGTSSTTKGDHYFMSFANFYKSWTYAKKWWAIMYTGSMSPAI